MILKFDKLQLCNLSLFSQWARSSTVERSLCILPKKFTKLLRFKRARGFGFKELLWIKVVKFPTSPFILKKLSKNITNHFHQILFGSYREEICDRRVWMNSFSYWRPCINEIEMAENIISVFRWKLKLKHLIRWKTWFSKPMKDAANCEMSRRVVCRLWTGNLRMGLPNRSGRIGNAGNWNVLVPAGREINWDAVSKGDWKQHKANRMIVRRE